MSDYPRLSINDNPQMLVLEYSSHTLCMPLADNSVHLFEDGLYVCDGEAFLRVRHSGEFNFFCPYCKMNGTISYSAIFKLLKNRPQENPEVTIIKNRINDIELTLSDRSYLLYASKPSIQELRLELNELHRQLKSHKP